MHIASDIARQALARLDDRRFNLRILFPRLPTMVLAPQKAKLQYFTHCFALASRNKIARES